MTTYRDRLREAMNLIAAIEPRAIFLGQAVAYPGTGMTDSFADIPRHRLLELPVMEDAQLGMATGLALAGELPIAIYPRINFLLLAINQLVLHLDALPRYSDYRPRVIIRTAVATPIPLDPGPQHLGDHSYAMEEMLQTVTVVRLCFPNQIVSQYRGALKRPGSSLMVEYIGSYDTE
jgi:pyruvate/2-oxoglutarate/acetoin dehydrogenase E1 component